MGGEEQDVADEDGEEECGPEQPRKKQKVVCYTCGSTGHMARDCEQTRCHYCGSSGHVAKTCTKGTSLHPEDQFILCDTLDENRGGGQAGGEGGAARCCVRRFIVPLSRARADFDLGDLREGRIDVGCRCVTGALFRSQGIRHNTEVRLCLGGDGDTGAAAVVAVSGGLVRDLLPDEASVASRLHYALGKLAREEEDAKREVEQADPPPARGGEAGREGAVEAGGRGGGQVSGQKQRQMQVLDAKMRRGIRCFRGATREALADAVTASGFPSPGGGGGGGPEGVTGSADAGRAYREGIVLMQLHPDGVPIDAFLRGLGPAGRRASEFVVLLGDDRGLRPDDEAALGEAAALCGGGAAVQRVSLGGAMLLASHCIVLVNHYIDTLHHACPARLWGAAGGMVAKRRKQTQRRRARKG